MHLFIKYGTVFVGSMFKFIFGPVTGEASGLPAWQTCGLTIAGMMASVLIFSLVGQEARKNWVSRLRRKGTSLTFTTKNRRIVMIWSRFGLGGIAFFTPVIFSPIIGTMLAVSFGVPTRRIVPAMLASALFWGLAFTYIVHVAGEKIFS